MIRALILISAICQASPAPAQSFDRAVKINLALAIRLCTQRVGRVDNRVGMFRAAGFSERVDRSNTNSDTTHYFNAPAETKFSIELYYGEMPEECVVSTRFLGVTEASKALDYVMGKLNSGYVRRVTHGQIDPDTGQPAVCVRYEDPANAIGEVIGVLPKDRSQVLPRKRHQHNLQC